MCMPFFPWVDTVKQSGYLEQPISVPDALVWSEKL